MISSLDETLKELLESELPAEFVGAQANPRLEVSFDAPGKGFKKPDLGVNLFLYDVHENRERRSAEPTWEKQNGTMLKHRPAIRVDCAYLITAWASTVYAPNAIDEHDVLGHVMKVLLRYPRIPLDFLKGELADQPVSLPVTSLQPSQLRSIGEFWHSMDQHAPKAILQYTVTISVAVHEPTEASVVREKLVTKLELK